MRKQRHHRAQKSVRRVISHENIEAKVFYGLLGIAVLVIGFLIITMADKNISNNDIEQKLVNGDAIGFLQGNQIDSVALQQFDQNYERLKSEQGINGDFYVYFEDVNGNIINVSGKKCFGSQTAEQTDPKCK